MTAVGLAALCGKHLRVSVLIGVVGSLESAPGTVGGSSSAPPRGVVAAFPQPPTFLGTRRPDACRRWPRQPQSSAGSPSASARLAGPAGLGPMGRRYRRRRQGPPLLLCAPVAALESGAREGDARGAPWSRVAAAKLCVGFLRKDSAGGGGLRRPRWGWFRETSVAGCGLPLLVAAIERRAVWLCAGGVVLCCVGGPPALNGAPPLSPWWWPAVTAQRQRGWTLRTTPSCSPSSPTGTRPASSSTWTASASSVSTLAGQIVRTPPPPPACFSSWPPLPLPILPVSTSSVCMAARASSSPPPACEHRRARAPPPRALAAARRRPWLAAAALRSCRRWLLRDRRRPDAAGCSGCTSVVFNDPRPRRTRRMPP